MASDDASDAGGFLSRWSRRKALVRQGVAVAEPAPAVAPPAAAPQPVAPTAGAPPVPAPVLAEPPAPGTAAAPPPPTMADVAALTRDADYARFMAPGVEAGVKNAALKRLFSDPHFNLMDGLDTYIDDYGRPDPLPAGMLRQMAQSKLLGLFDDEPAPAAVTAPSPGPLPDPTDTPSDEDADLRLQPLDAAGPAGAGPGPGPDAGRQC